MKGLLGFSAALPLILALPFLFSEYLWRISAHHINADIHSYRTAYTSYENIYKQWQTAHPHDVALVQTSNGTQLVKWSWMYRLERLWFVLSHRGGVFLDITDVKCEYPTVVVFHKANSTLDWNYFGLPEAPSTDVEDVDAPLDVVDGSSAEPVRNTPEPVPIQHAIWDRMPHAIDGDISTLMILHVFGGPGSTKNDKREFSPTDEQGSFLFAVRGLHEAKKGEQREAAWLYLQFLVQTLAADIRAPLNGLPPLHLAAMKHDLRFTKLLLRHLPAKGINKTIDGGRTPLHLMARHTDIFRNEEFTRWLAQPVPTEAEPFVGGGPDVALMLNRTFAFRKDLIEMYSGLEGALCHALHAAGVDVNAVDRSGASALHLASYSGAVTTVGTLLKLKVDPNRAERNFKQTALHVAASRGFVEVCKVLLEEGGADANALDVYGRSAADYASLSVQDEELVNYLLSKGAKLTTPKPKRSASGKCDIAVLAKTKAKMTVKKFQKDYQSLRRPVLLRGEFDRWKQPGELTVETLVQDHEDRFTFRLEYPHLYSNAKRLAFNETTTLPEYLKYLSGTNEEEAAYIFDTEALEQYAETLLDKVENPDFFEMGRPNAMQFSVGNDKTGSHPHFHESAWNGVSQGSKQWMLYRPRDAFFAAVSGVAFKRRDEAKQALTCTQNAGDMLYLPSEWGHTLVNSKETTVAVAIQFDQENLDFVGAY